MDKTPPHNLDAEQAVLGSVFRDPEVLADVSEIISPADFYNSKHGAILQTMVDLYNNNLPPNLITVTEELQKAGKLDAIGGMSFVANLANREPTGANAVHYAKIVKEKSVVRQIIKNAQNLVTMGYSGEYSSAEELVNKAEAAMFEIGQKQVKSTLEPIRGLLHKRMDAIEERAKQKGISGISTTFRPLDIVTSGLHPSELIIVAARPSMGKTSFAFQVGMNSAIQHHKHVAIFSLEQDKERSIDQMLTNCAMVDGQRYQLGRLNEDEWYRLSSASGKLSTAPVYIDETAGISVPEIRSKCRRLKSQAGLDLIIIDYLQLMSGHKRAENRNMEITHISSGLKNLAKELKVPVMALSQLSREVTKRQDKKPALSDLRESGSLEQTADLVMFIHREEYYNPDTEKKGVAEIIIAKQRHGPTGTVELAWMKEFRRFMEIDIHHQAESMGTVEEGGLWPGHDGKIPGK